MVIAAGLALGLVQTGSPALAAGASPGAVFSAVSHEFGTVKQGEKVVHVFPFRNETEAPLKIERVELSMGGMKTGFKPVIPPGGQGRITVEWNTARVRGKVSGEAVVHFADAALPPVTLVLRGAVKPSIEIQPYAAVFFSVFKGEGAERSITVVNNEERPLTITRIEPEGKHFTTALETVTPGKVQRLHVTVPPDVAPGRYMEAAYLHTDHPVYAKLKVAVNVLVKNDLYINPETVEFGRVSLESLKKNQGLLKLLGQTFLVKKRHGEFKIKSIASDVPALRITQSPAAGPSETFRIDVSLDRDDLKPGKLSGSLRIKTDSAEFPELLVPVRGELR